MQQQQQETGAHKPHNGVVLSYSKRTDNQDQGPRTLNELSFSFGAVVIPDAKSYQIRLFFHIRSSSTDEIVPPNLQR